MPHADTAAPLIGIWKMDASSPATGAFRNAEGLQMTDFIIDAPARGLTRSADGELWRAYLNLDPAAHTLRVHPYTGETVVYGWTMPDAAHLRLAPEPPKQGEKPAAPAPASATLQTFTRVPTPAHYPLLDRGFHLVDEWGLER